MRSRLLLAAGVAGLAFGANVGTAAEITLPSGPGRDLVYANCRTCHDLQYLADSAGITRGDWDAVLDNMRQYGLRLPEDTRKTVLDYLATYLGPTPSKAPGTTAAAPSPTADGVAATPGPTTGGAVVYREQCSVCHGPAGKGTGDQFPPLAGNRDIFADRLFPVYVVLNGLQGPIDVAGKAFNNVMPPFGHLSDATIAAAVNHVRTSWGNAALRPSGMTALEAADVGKARGTPMTAAEVHAYRTRHKR